MEVEMYHPLNKKCVNIDRKNNLIDFCVTLIDSCCSFEQLKAASRFCSLALEHKYIMPVKARRIEEFEKVENKREALMDYFGEKLLYKAKSLTPYLSHLPEEELSRIFWN